MTITRSRVVGALLGLLGSIGAGGLAGCGASAGGPPATLPAREVPYLSTSIKSVSPSSLAREAQDPSLATRLRHWGFEIAADRYFQGESRRLQVVDSRTLRFHHTAGATAFVSYMRAHLSPILGSFPMISAYRFRDRDGILAVGQECQCHLANPTFLALVARRGMVSWLEINGPAATRERVAALLARTP